MTEISSLFNFEGRSYALTAHSVILVPDFSDAGEKSLWTEPRLSSITQSSWHAHLHADLWEELYGVRICGYKLANRWSIYLITLSALLLRPVANYEVTEVRASVNCSCSKIRAATTNLLNRLLSIMKIIGNDSHYQLVGSAHSAHLLLKLFCVHSAAALDDVIYV